jgi:hypothetical protein
MIARPRLWMYHSGMSQTRSHESQRAFEYGFDLGHILMHVLVERSFVFNTMEEAIFPLIVVAKVLAGPDIQSDAANLE